MGPNGSRALEDPGLRGIAALIRSNRSFRRLWLAQVVSQLGDWFQHVAVLSLLVELTGSGRAVGLALILRMLPLLVVSPWSGVIVDRFDRRRIMILSDLGRALVVCGFLLVDRPERVPVAYAVLVAHVTLGAFFEPARQAFLPNLVRRRELLSANALMSLTWSLALAFGSALGGVVIAWTGLDAAFLLDAASFVLSAALLRGLPPDVRAVPALKSARDGFRDLVAGLRYAFLTRGVRSLVFVKPSVGLAGGLVLLLGLLGEERLAVAGSGSLGIGLLFAARGLGTAVGPFAARAITAYHEDRMRRLLGPAFLEAALFFVAFGLVADPLQAFFLLLFAHLGTSANWVFSTVLLQTTVPDGLRGRVFSAEMSLFTITFCAATWFTGQLHDIGIDPGRLASGCGLLLAVPGVVYVLLSRRGGLLRSESSVR